MERGLLKYLFLNSAVMVQGSLCVKLKVKKCYPIIDCTIVLITLANQINCMKRIVEKLIFFFNFRIILF